MKRIPNSQFHYEFVEAGVKAHRIDDAPASRRFAAATCGGKLIQRPLQ